MKSFIFLISFLLSSSLFANTDFTHIKEEYIKFEKLLLKTKPDGVIGSIMNYKKMKGFEYLWDIRDGESEYSVIRIYREHSDGTPDFYVSYYVGTHLVDGKKVVRRFVGPMHVGMWRNDTVDFNSNEYYGKQGLDTPAIDVEDNKLLQKLGIHF